MCRKASKSENASMFPCGFWRIDGQKLDIKPWVESFVVSNIQKGNTDVEINFYMGINDEKGKSHEDYVELWILYFI
jgi:hypothetical protein